MIFYGQSIGSGIAAVGYKYCKTTFGQSPAGLVLISPYLSIKTLGQDIVSTCVPILDRLETRENIKYCETGLLIMHGDKDNVIPVNHGKELDDIAKCHVKMLDIMIGIGHNDIPYDRIINNFRVMLGHISSDMLYENMTYRNNICWDDRSNYEQVELNSISTTMATCVEATSASTMSLCVMF